MSDNHIQEIVKYVERMKTSAEDGELYGFAANCQWLLCMLNDATSLPQSDKQVIPENLKRIGMVWIHKDGAVWEFNADKDREETLGMIYVPVYAAMPTNSKEKVK
jgi:hypothetical protein